MIEPINPSLWRSANRNTARNSRPPDPQAAAPRNRPSRPPRSDRRRRHADGTELRTIASAPREDQAAVWKQFKPRKGETVIWWRLSQALDKTRFFARDAKFGEDERAAFGIIWQEDLFAEGDEDNRFTIDGEAFIFAQRAWLDAHMPKNGVLLDVDEYGREKLPPRAQRTWTKPKRGDEIGFHNPSARRDRP